MGIVLVGTISVGIVSVDVGVAGRWLPNGLQVWVRAHGHLAWVPAPIRVLSAWILGASSTHKGSPDANHRVSSQDSQMK